MIDDICTVQTEVASNSSGHRSKQKHEFFLLSEIVLETIRILTFSSKVFLQKGITEIELKKRPKIVDMKFTSNAAWWIKEPKKLKHRAALCQDMADLCRNISMHGYDVFAAAELLVCEKYARLIWFCLHFANLIIVITVLSHTWEKFVSQNFGLHLHEPLYPIENIPFPGISICSNNRISARSAAQYASELSSRDPVNRPTEYFMNFMPYFSSLYYKFERADDYRLFGEFQTFLDNYGIDGNESYYNISKTLQMLTPPCSDLIVKCYLNGQQIECFGENAFQEDLTMYGPCCIFNGNDKYRKRNSTFRLAGPELGLTVVLNSSHSDDMSSLFNMDAYIVIIHKPGDFPDINSGSAIEVFPMNNAESFIAVASKYLNTSRELKGFDAISRKCYFDDSPEIDHLLQKSYSFSNCIMRCRVQSISALCLCVPYFVSAELMKQFGVPYCTLHYIGCLQQYRFKWNNVLTERAEILGLERELEDALYCPQCLAPCDDIQYGISLMSLPRGRPVMEDTEGDAFNLNLKDMPVLRVYFGSSTAFYYKRFIINTWEEAFSTVGNILAIFLGFSMVAIFEIFYIITKYLYIAWKMFMRKRRHDTSVSENRMAATIKCNQLYILP